MSYCNYGLTELIFHLSNEFNWTLILSLNKAYMDLKSECIVYQCTHIVDKLNELIFIQ